MKNDLNLVIETIFKKIVNTLMLIRATLNFGSFFPFLISLCLVFVFLFRLGFLYSSATLQDDNNNSDNSIKKPKTETQLLFEELIQSKHLFKIKNDGRIVLPTKDYALLQKVTGGVLSKKDELLLKRLYYSIAGKSLQYQVRLWNHSRLFAAVRDNIQHSGKSTESRWIPSDHWGEKPLSSDWIPLNFGYINGGELKKGFNDWISVSNEVPITFTLKQNFSHNKIITLQVVGQPDISKLVGKKTLYACHPLTLKERKKGKDNHCKKVTSIDPSVSAYMIKLALKAGLHKIQLTVTPTTNSKRKISGLAISLNKQQNQFKWQPLAEYKRNPVASSHSADENYSFHLTTQDGKALTNPIDATPSRFSFDNGLVPLIGYDTSDRYALSGIFSRSRLPHDQTKIRLTIDSRLQAIAQKHLIKEIPSLGTNKAYAKRRRAAVVLLNPQTGAILAAANYPKPKKGIHRWDRLSYSRLYPNRDPFGVNAWQGLNNNNAPGSTFKTVTALAALQAADEGRDDLEKMIKGLSKNEFKNLTGLDISASSYQPDPDPEVASTVFNAGHAQLAIALPYYSKTKQNKTVLVKPKLRISGGGGCPSKPIYSSTLGMKEAIRNSLNIWFARLGIMMDKDNLDTGGKDTSLATMATLLGFGSISSLTNEKIPLRRIKGGAGRGDILNAYAGGISLNNSRIIKKEQTLLKEGRIEHNSALQRLSQNSFGQGVATTPLQMAKIAATIATGRIPQPYLIKQWDNKEYLGKKGRKLKPSLIQYLKQGMKAVPEAGTAAKAFKRFYKQGQCQTYGKTGSAQVVKAKKRGEDSPFNTAWFIGWHEDKNAKPDVSFACMVTHTYAKHKRSGGSVCAPIIARILKDMATKPSNKMDSNKKGAKN